MVKWISFAQIFTDEILFSLVNIVQQVAKEAFIS